MKKVLLIINSMGMPRDDYVYEETWPYLLLTELPQFHYIQRFQRALSVSDLTGLEPEKHRINFAQGQDFLEMFQPDIVVLELGITDCAPRLFSTKELQWFSRLRLIHWIRLYREKYSYRKTEKCITPLPDFEKHLNDFTNRCFNISVEKLILIPMAAATEGFLQVSPYVQESITIYNGVFKKLSEQDPDRIDCLESFSSVQMKTISFDIMHYNAAGHVIIKNQIASLLKKNL